MNKKIFFGRSIKDILVAFGPSVLLLIIALAFAYKYVNPAPPRHIVISTGADEGDYNTYAKLYKDIIKDDGITLEIRPSSGAAENLKRLQDPKSDVDIGFVQDGLGSSEAAPDLVSLGSLYYEPIWIFYRGQKEVSRFSELIGKKIAVGEQGSGTEMLTLRLLKASGVDSISAKFIHTSWLESAHALTQGDVDAAFFFATPDDPLIGKLVADKSIRLMSLDQAEAITRQIPFLHHLVLPHGSLNIKLNLPAKDIHLVSPTATLLMRDSLHPALVYLLLKAATQVHSEPGIFEKKDEFPIDKDYEFPLSDEAKHFYKSGTPFWQRYLPFWLATLVDRFIIVIFPLMALVIPLVKLVPRILDWRLKSRFYKRYGELKFLETQIKAEPNHNKYAEHLRQLDEIEDRVNHMKVPLDFSDHVYGLREHIDFVRGRLTGGLTKNG